MTLQNNLANLSFLTLLSALIFYWIGTFFKGFTYPFRSLLVLPLKTNTNNQIGSLGSSAAHGVGAGCEGGFLKENFPRILNLSKSATLPYDAVGAMGPSEVFPLGKEKAIPVGAEQPLGGGASHPQPLGVLRSTLKAGGASHPRPVAPNRAALIRVSPSLAGGSMAAPSLAGGSLAAPSLAGGSLAAPGQRGGGQRAPGHRGGPPAPTWGWGLGAPSPNLGLGAPEPPSGQRAPGPFSEKRKEEEALGGAVGLGPRKRPGENIIRREKQKVSEWNFLKKKKKNGTEENLIQNIAYICILVSNLLLSCLLIIRWKESGHLPLSNLYESLMFLSWCFTVLHLIFEKSTFTTILTNIMQLDTKKKTLDSYNQVSQQKEVFTRINIIGAITTPSALFTNAFATFTLPKEMQEVTPLVPALQSNWLMMHVTVMILSYAALILGSLLAIAFLIVTADYPIKTKTILTFGPFLKKGSFFKIFSNSGKKSSTVPFSASSTGLLQSSSSREGCLEPLATSSMSLPPFGGTTSSAKPDRETPPGVAARGLGSLGGPQPQVGAGGPLPQLWAGPLTSWGLPPLFPGYEPLKGPDHLKDPVEPMKVPSHLKYQAMERTSPGQTKELVEVEKIKGDTESLGKISFESEIQNLALTLDNLSYRILGIGFPFLTIGILSGAVWANEAWGSYWSWDPKETWALLTWLIFAIYFHTRIQGGSGKQSAKIATVGFIVVWICYLGVNLIGEGLHSYGMLS
uniref:Cytochrome c biogenesis protein CcsA n=1 Tax=Haematococcus lacustris TaxID=44745 RepID=A0A2K9YRJ6_HAELA|nr:cytochrome c biogenesis protein CcsA [Haematococcus lacustris]AUW36444.1 cytochrome c biogenesis protein CcsA [Haematococcus lacustris]